MFIPLDCFLACLWAITDLRYLPAPAYQGYINTSPWGAVPLSSSENLFCSISPSPSTPFNLVINYGCWCSHDRGCGCRLPPPPRPQPQVDQQQAAHRPQRVDCPPSHHIVHERLRWLHDERTSISDSVEGRLQQPHWQQTWSSQRHSG